jgi:hypothetical protein
MRSVNAVQSTGTRRVPVNTWHGTFASDRASTPASRWSTPARTSSPVTKSPT